MRRERRRNKKKDVKFTKQQEQDSNVIKQNEAQSIGSNPIERESSKRTKLKGYQMKPWYKRKRIWTTVISIGLSVFVFFKPKYKPIVDETLNIIQHQPISVEGTARMEN